MASATALKISPCVALFKLTHSVYFNFCSTNARNALISCGLMTGMLTSLVSVSAKAPWQVNHRFPSIDEDILHQVFYS
ncbi:hypothetical protein [Klebsiella quasipneumoniae]|uniref:hypothetical protein n=1 Tax=Klebsiella quasipneumoniae TaxID=1463165 RepID=UPI001F0CFDA0|nr:hypothetical protein [Klebsiella quasipneumoniae]